MQKKFRKRNIHSKKQEISVDLLMLIIRLVINWLDMLCTNYFGSLYLTKEKNTLKYLFSKFF